MTRGTPALPGPTAQAKTWIGMRTRGGGRMRLSEFLKYLIVPLLVMALFVAVAR